MKLISLAVFLLHPSSPEMMDVWGWDPDTSTNFNNPSSVPEERKWFVIPSSPLDTLIISFACDVCLCRSALTQKLWDLIQEQCYTHANRPCWKKGYKADYYLLALPLQTLNSHLPRLHSCCIVSDTSSAHSGLENLDQTTMKQKECQGQRWWVVQIFLIMNG